MSGLAEVGAQLVYREAHYLDNQNWDEWLAMFLEDCEYWVPAWKSEHQPTVDPKRELSLIYYSSRSGLEDRVWRVRSGKSVASTPMPRTHHVITNVLLDESAALPGTTSPESLRVLSNWTVHQYRTKYRTTDVLYGRYEHEFAKRDGEWRIARKKVILLNDTMPAALDYYSL